MTRALSLLLTGLVALCAGGGVLREARIPAQAEAVRPVPGKALELPSFDGATVTVVVGRRSVSTAGVVTYGGRTSGSWFSNASIVMTGGGGLVATVSMGGSVLSFRLKGGEWTVRETAQAARGGRRCTVKRPPAPAAAGNGRSARLRAGLTGRPTIDGAAYMKRGEVYTNVIDVLVGVDASAARWIRESSDFAGEERALELFAADAIQRSNDVCGNTDLDQLFSFNLAGVVEVGVDCSVFREPYYGIVDLDTILDGLAERRGRGEYLAAYTQVRERRELFCADLVTFFVSGGEEALESMVGLGYSLDDVTIKYADFAEYAYSVCVVEAVAIDTTLAQAVTTTTMCSTSISRTMRWSWLHLFTTERAAARWRFTPTFRACSFTPATSSIPPATRTRARAASLTKSAQASASRRRSSRLPATPTNTSGRSWTPRAPRFWTTTGT